MSVVLLEKQLYKELYSQGEYSILQSWEWGEVKSPVWKAVRLGIGNFPLTVLIRKLPYSNKSMAYIPRGFSDRTLSVDLLSEVVEFLKKNYKLTNIDIDSEVQDIELLKDFEKVGFFSSGEQIQPQYTRMINLSTEIDQIFKQMERTARNKVHKMEKRGCEIKLFESGEEGFGIYWGMMEYILKSTGYASHDRQYHKKIWDIMSKVGYGIIIVAYYQNKPFGAYMVLKNHHTLYELFGGINDYARGISGGGAGYYLKWNSIKFSNQLGLKLYDMWGIGRRVDGEYEKDHPLYKIGLFKEKFGGEYIEFIPRQTLILDKLGYKFFNAGVKLNSFFIKARKFFK